MATDSDLWCVHHDPAGNYVSNCALWVYVPRRGWAEGPDWKAGNK